MTDNDAQNNSYKKAIAKILGNTKFVVERTGDKVQILNKAVPRNAQIVASTKAGILTDMELLVLMRQCMRHFFCLKKAFSSKVDVGRIVRDIEYINENMSEIVGPNSKFAVERTDKKIRIVNKSYDLIPQIEVSIKSAKLDDPELLEFMHQSILHFFWLMRAHYYHGGV